MRYLMAASAALSAVNVFLLGYPGDFVPQAYMLIIGGGSAGVAAFIAVLAKPE